MSLPIEFVEKYKKLLGEEESSKFLLQLIVQVKRDFA